MPVRTIIAGFGFLKTKDFWVIELGNTVQGLGYFIPQLYLPSKCLSTAAIDLDVC